MLDVIIRKTYGFNKKEDKIATSQFMDMAGLSRIAVYKARKKLREMNLIAISQKGDTQTLGYKFNKHYDEWRLSPKKETVTQKGVSQKGIQVSPKKVNNCHPKGSIQKKERQYTKDITENFVFFKDNNFKKTYQAFLEMRKGQRKKPTKYAEELILKKLHAKDIETAIVMLEQSIENSWQGVFPLRKGKGDLRVQSVSASQRAQLEAEAKSGHKV